MAGTWGDNYEAGSKNPAGPEGLRQTAAGVGRVRQGEDGGRAGTWAEQQGYVDASRTWFTGANQQGTNNGLDTAFMDAMQKQYSEAADSGEGLKKYYDFATSKTTGIATFDYESEDGNRKYRFGDIYDNGEFKGNLYDEKSSGYDRDTANTIMSYLAFDKDQQAAIFSASDRVERLDREVEEWHQKNNAEVPKALQAQIFQGEVDERQAEFQEGAGDDIATAAAGAAGGAAVGAGVGSIVPGVGTTVGGVIGGVVGGVGAWLNRDELTEQAARATLITEMANKEFSGLQGFFATTGTALEQWGGVAGKFLSPLSNTVHGLYDGNRGDGQSDFYAVDNEGDRKAPLWLRGVDLGAGVADALGTFATGTGLALYTAQMSATIVGETSMLASTGSSFDYRRGDFDNVFTDDDGNFDFSSGAAGIGKVGIDVVQLGMARGLAGQAQASRVAAGEQAAPTLMQRGLGKISDRIPLGLGGTRGLAAGEERVRAGAFSFTRGADGAIVDGSRRGTLSLLAPSEALGAITTGFLARRTAATRPGAGAVTSDDFYRAAMSMATGQRRITAAVTNAFGEGGEEFAQAILEPMSHNARIDFGQAYEAAAQGFAMGLGMSLGSSARGANAAKQLRARADLNYEAMFGTALTDEKWAELTDVQQRAYAAWSPSVRAQAEAARQIVLEEQGANRTAGVQDVAKLDDFITSQRDKALAKMTNRTDGSFKITGIQDITEMPNHAAVASAGQVASILKFQREGLEIQRKTMEEQLQEVGDPASPESQALQMKMVRAELAIKMYDEIVAPTLTQLMGDLGGALEVGRMDYARDRVNEINQALAAFFDRRMDMHPNGNALNQEELNALARSVSPIFSRSPEDKRGSHQVLLPQVSWDLTRENVQGLVQVSHAILAPISGDYDGDQIRQRAQMILDDADFAALRGGETLLGAGESVDLASQKYEKWNFQNIAQALTSSSDTLVGLADHVFQTVGDAVRLRYAEAPSMAIDAALQKFFAAARTADPDARQVLVDELAKQAGGFISQMARANLSNEWLWIDQVVQRALRDFQKAFVSYRPENQGRVVTAASATAISPIEQSAKVKERLLEEAAVPGMTLGIWGEGSTLFRQFQKLHYGKINSAVLSAEEGDTSQLLELARFYEMLGQRITETELEQITAKDNITATVIASLERLATQLHRDPEFAGVDRTVLPALLANVQVQDFDVDENGVPTPNRGKISIAQLLLRRAVQRDQIDKAQVLDRSPELQAKHARLLGMSRATHDDGPINAERAFIEVFSATPLYKLLGTDGAAIFGPHRTVEQFLRVYTGMHETDRRDSERALMNDPRYTGRKQTRSMPYNLSDMATGEITAFRSVLDSILSVGRYEVSATAGKPNGARAQRSAETSTAFRNSLEQLQDAIDRFLALPGNFRSESRADTAQRMFESNPDMARSWLALLPADTARVAFDMVDGEVMIANWVYGVFDVKDTKQAEMYYWRNILLAQWRGTQGHHMLEEDTESSDDQFHQRQYYKLPRRMLRIMYKMAAQGDIAMSRFLDELTTATDLDVFMKWVNDNAAIRGHQAPLLAWVDDTADFDADKAGGGWAKNMAGAELREAIGNLQAQAGDFVHDLQEEKVAIEADAHILRALRRGAAAVKQQTGQGPDAAAARGADVELFKKFERMLEFASNRLVAMGPAAMVQQTIGSALGFYGQAHTKGQNPLAYTMAGLFEAQRDAVGYATNFERVMAALTTQNLDAVGNSLGQAAKDDIRSMDDHGNVVEWKKPTAEAMIELFENTETRAIARAILFPAVMEYAGDGRLTQQFLVGKSLKEFLTKETFSQQLFETNANENLAAPAAQRYYSFLESQARVHGGHFAVQRAANDLVIARTSAARQTLSAEDITKMTHEAYREIAEVMQVVGAIAADERLRATEMAGKPSLLDQVRDQVRLAQQKVTGARKLGYDVRDKAVVEEAVKEQITAREMELEDEKRQLDALRTAAKSKREKALIDKRIAAAEQSFQTFKDVTASVMSDATFDTHIAPYLNAQDTETRRLLADYIQATPILQRRIPTARDAITSLLHQINDPRYDGTPILSDKDWDTISLAVVSVVIEDLAFPGAKDLAVPLYPDVKRAELRRYYDSSFAYLLDSLLTPAMIEAAADIHLMANRVGVTKTDADLMALLDRTILDDRRLGDWTSDIARSTIEAHQRLDASAAAAAISISGNSPKTQVAISTATRRTFLVPDASLQSSVTLNLAQLQTDNRNATIATSIPKADGSGHTVLTPLWMLNNRFASTAMMAVTLPDGTETELDLLHLGAEASARSLLALESVQEVGIPYVGNDDALNSGYQVVTLDRIRRAIESLAQIDGLDVRKGEVKLTFFHPDAQPAGPEWMHNVFFEGTSFGLAGDNMISLNASLWFANGSISPEGQRAALDANKLGKPALTVIPVPTAAEREAIENGWDEDFGRMLQLKTQQILNTDLGDGTLDPHFANAVYKNVKLRHFVRGLDNGKTVVLTAEQALELQKNSGGERLTSLLDNAELWVPSDDVLRTMIGEQGDQGSFRNYEDPFIFNSELRPQFNTVTPTMVSEFFEGTAPRALEDTRIAARARQFQLRLRPQMDETTVNAYDLRIKQLEALRAPIRSARNRYTDDTNARFSLSRNMVQAVQAANDAISAENIAFDWSSLGIPWIGPRSSYDTNLSKLLLSSLAKVLRKDGATTGWVFSMADEFENDPATGKLNAFSLEEQEADVAMRVAPGDLVVIELSSFRGDRDQIEKVLTHFIGLGANIVLGSGDGSNNSIAESAWFLREHGYDHVAGSKHVFQPREMAPWYQNRKARESTQLELRTVTTRSQVLNFLTQGEYLAEGTAWVVPKDTSRGDRETLRDIGVSLNLVKTDFLHDFNVPTPEQASRVQQQLTSMLSNPEIVDRLAQVAGEDAMTTPKGKSLDEAIEAFLQRNSSDPMTWGGQEFGTGDIIPLVNGQGQILLYRHGYMAPTRWEAFTQWTAKRPDSDGPMNLTVFPSKAEPRSTTHTGTVRKFNHRPGHGLSVELDIPLSIFGDKKQLEWSGVKYILSPMPESFHLPNDPVFGNGWGIDLVSDTDTAFGKEGYPGLVDNFRNAFAFFGIDFMPDLQKFFQADANQVRNILDVVARRAPRISVSMANELIGGPNLEPALVAMMQQLATENPDKITLDNDWATGLYEETVEASIARAMLVYLMVPGAKKEDVLRTGGFNTERALSGEGVSLLMPPLFTQVFDNAPIGSALRDEMFRRINGQMNPSYRLRSSDWKVEVKTDQGIREGYLQFVEAHSSGDNPFKNEMVFDFNEKQPVSIHTEAVGAQSVGAGTAYAGNLERAQSFLSERTRVRLNEGGLWDMMTGLPSDDISYMDWMAPTPAEQQYYRQAREAIIGFRQKLDQDEWSAADVKAYETKTLQITRKLGLQDSQVEVVDFWVRQILGQPLGEAEVNGRVMPVGNIGGAAAIEAAADILDNVNDGLLPVVSGEVAQLSLIDLQLLYRAHERGNRWTPRVSLDPDTEPAGGEWSAWVDIALGSSEMDTSTLFDPLYLLAMDGFMHQYQNATESLVGLPVSRDALKARNLLDETTNRLVASLDTVGVDRLLSEPSVMETARASLQSLLGEERITGQIRSSRWQRVAPAGEVAKRRAQRRQWRRENGVPFPADVTMKDFRKRGAAFTDTTTTANAVIRGMLNLRIGNALLNPQLWISAGPEMWVRSAQDTLANMLTGDTTGRGAGAMELINRGTNALADKLDARAEELEKLGDPTAAKYRENAARYRSMRINRYTDQQVEDMKALHAVLGSRQDFRQMIYNELLYLRPWQPGIGRIERGLEAYAKFGSRLQDPTWGMKADNLARRYTEAAISYIMTLPTENAVSIDTIIAGMRTDPKWIQRNFPDAHKAASNAVAQIRSLKQTPISIALRGIYEPLSERGGGIGTASNLLLKMPLIFSGYAANVITTITGMQGASDALAMFLHGRKGGAWNWAGIMHAKLAGEKFNPDAYTGIDMSAVIESLDLSRSFIRGNLTLTGIFTMGMLAGGLGLGGEDEEMKKRRRAAELQGAGVIYDPRRLENDFREHDSIFLDNIPGLNKLFSVTDMEGNKHSVTNLPWIFKQFVSPVMGIERFLQTGDPRQVMWGFEDAIGSFPLINSIMWDDTVATAQELFSNAEAAAEEGDPRSMSASARFLTSFVGTYERMLMENSFVNSIYMATDRYDRDPFALPAVDSDGNPQVQMTPEGPQPVEQNLALTPYVDPETGEVREGYMARSRASAQLHTWTENRFGLALLTSLIPGNGNTFRQSMVPKERAFDKAPIDAQNSEAFVKAALMGAAKASGEDAIPMLSEQEIVNLLKNQYKARGEWYEETELEAQAKKMAQNMQVQGLTVLDQEGYERFTKAGIAANLQGLVKGTVQLGDESLQGFYMTPEMRREIQKEWMADIVQEGVNLGLTETQAFYRMQRIWNGPSDNPDTIGIRDILWSDKIPDSDTVRYRQLNTTYVTGPDGLPWATSVTRSGWAAALGIIPGRLWQPSDMGGEGTVTLDSRLNVADPQAKINTGLRALEKVDESSKIPSEEEILKGIAEDIAYLKDKQFAPESPATKPVGNYGGYGGGGYRRYGGGGGYSGGGGSAYFTRLNPLPFNQSPYGNSVPFINTSNPIIRRANIRRERISSERGRLNQWQ